MSLDLSAFKACLEPHLQSPRWLIAYSGGVDSTALLYALWLWSKEQQLPELVAFHVNHHLSPLSTDWQRHCAAQCEALGISLIEHEVQVEIDGYGKEAAARDARYELFIEELRADELLLLAHHSDDQAETLLLRLMRGAGLEGLTAMPQVRAIGAGMLARPLLPYSREQLRAWAVQQGLDWIEDDTNVDTSIDRNFLRHDVLPILEQRWPAYRGNMLKAIDNLIDNQQLLQRYLQPQLEARAGLAYGVPTLSLAGWEQLDGIEQAALLRSWLQLHQCPLPDRSVLTEFLRQVVESQPGAQPELRRPEYCVSRYREQLFLRNSAHPPQPCLQRVPGGGINPALEPELSIVSRRGGERCQPSGRSRSQSLKKLLQEYGLPTWQREALPLVVNANGDIVAVADLWVCSGFEAGQGEAGLQLVWR